MVVLRVVSSLSSSVLCDFFLSFLAFRITTDFLPRKLMCKGGTRSSSQVFPGNEIEGLAELEAVGAGTEEESVTGAL